MKIHKKSKIIIFLILSVLLLTSCSAVLDRLGLSEVPLGDVDLGEGEIVVLPEEAFENADALAAAIELTDLANESITAEAVAVVESTPTLEPTVEVTPEATVDTEQLTAVAYTQTAEVIALTPTEVPPTATPAPTEEPTITATPDGWVPSPTPAECLAMRYVSDVNYPDGSVIAPGGVFYKTWRVQNVGSCTWRADYSIVHASGYLLEAQSPTPLGINVFPDQYVNLTLRLVAPFQNGAYRGDFEMMDPDGNLFGVGDNFDQTIWVEVVVVNGTN